MADNPFAQSYDVGSLNVAPINLPQAKPKGGMFGGGGKFGLKEAIAFGLAGFMSRRNPALLQGLMGAMMQKQNNEREDQQYQQRRGDQFEDWRKQQEFKLAHPDPANPHYFEDNSGNLLAVDPATGKPMMVYQDPNPFKLVPNGMGGVVPVNMQELMRGAKPAPQGVTFTPIDGGPAAPPPATFPKF